jgi:heptosyltransferase-2
VAKRKLKADGIKRVVVRGTNWVGDAVMTVPALRELRRLLPNAHITLVSRPNAADIFLDAEFIDDVIVYQRSGLGDAWGQVCQWRRQRFDLALLLQNAFEAAAIAFLARVPTRLGYDADRRRTLLTYPVPLPEWKDARHEVFYYLNLVAELERLLFGTSVIADHEPRFGINVPDHRRQSARQILREQGARDDAPLILLCPGSINSRAKRWPAESYAELADHFIGAGANVVLLGSPSEIEVSRQVCRQMRQQPILLTGKTTVAEAAATISVADILITNDTGPAHIGAAVGTPTLVIFGPTNPLTTRPFAPAAEIIRHPPECAPCMLRDCPIDHRCMTAITPDEVFERARAILTRQQVEVTT